MSGSGAENAMRQWAIAQLKSILQFNEVDDLYAHLMTIQQDADIRSELMNLLGTGPASKKFVNEFIDRKKCLSQPHQPPKVKKKPPPPPTEQPAGGSNSKKKEAPLEQIQFAGQTWKVTKAKTKKPKKQEAPAQPAPILVGSGGGGGAAVKNLDQLKDLNRVLLPGRHPCNCEARTHKLLTNCLNCGKIVCEQEGYGPCFFCGYLVVHPSHQQQIQQQQHQAGVTAFTAEDLQKAIAHRDRLLNYDRTSEKRTVVIDDQADYYESDANQWLSADEKEKLRREEEKNRKEKQAMKHQIRFTIDFAGRRILVEDDNKKDTDTALIEEYQRQIEHDFVQEQQGAHRQRTTSKFDQPDDYEGDSGGSDGSDSGVGKKSRSSTATTSKAHPSVMRHRPKFTPAQKPSQQKVQQQQQQQQQSYASAIAATSSRVQHPLSYGPVPDSEEDEEYYDLAGDQEDDRYGRNDKHAEEEAEDEADLARRLKKLSLITQTAVPPQPKTATTNKKQQQQQQQASNKGKSGTGASKLPATIPPQTQRPGSDIVYINPSTNEDDLGVCLSMHQPWASLLVLGIKRHEGRSWSTPYRGRVWIASTAQQPSKALIREVEAQYEKLGRTNFPQHYPVSQLLGCLDLVECLTAEEYKKAISPELQESESEHVFICLNPRQLVMPFRISGKPKLWTLPKKTLLQAQCGLKPLDSVVLAPAEESVIPDDVVMYKMGQPQQQQATTKQNK